MRKPPTNHNGGSREVFPRAVGHGLMDLRAIRLEIEEAETVAEGAGTPTAERKRWRNYRDHLERALDVRIELLDRAAQSHDRIISKAPTAFCRAYEPNDPSVAELRMACSGRCHECQAAEVAA